MRSLPLISALLVASAPMLAGPDPRAEALAIHRSSLIVDTHVDTPQRFLEEGFDLATTTPVTEGHLDFEKIQAGNLGAAFFSIWADSDYEGEFAHRALELIESVYAQAERHPDRMVIATSVQDILAARSGKKPRLAALMGVEGGHAIENDLALLRVFHRLGVRYMTLTWANTNEWADSSGDLDNPKVKHHDGLTPFGREVVLEMNRLGMMVDISHVSDKTFFDTLEVSRAPVIASHSSARALTDSPRNMTDDMLRAVAKKGGVVMVNFFSAFVDQNFRNAFEAQRLERKVALEALDKKLAGTDRRTRYREQLRAQVEWAAKIPRPPFKSLIDHIDHVAKVAGIDHVGLGSDFDGISSLPEGIDSAADLPKITEALYARGYRKAELQKLLGGNLLRVFKECERVSRELRRPAPR